MQSASSRPPIKQRRCRFPTAVPQGRQAPCRLQIPYPFCVEPTCACTEARLSILAVGEDGLSLDEQGSATIATEKFSLIGFDGGRAARRIFAGVFLEWCRRDVPPRERLRELCDRTRKRGLELLDLAAARAGAPAQTRAVARLPEVARNAPCPCGSGRKFKRCCGA